MNGGRYLHPHWSYACLVLLAFLPLSFQILFSDFKKEQYKSRHLKSESSSTRFLKIRFLAAESIRWAPHEGHGEQSSNLIYCFWHWFSGFRHLLPFVVWRNRQMRSREGAGFISMKLFEEKVMEQHINILRGQSCIALMLSRSFSSSARFISLNHFTWCIYYCFSLAWISPACVLGAFYICLECKFD